MAKLLLLTLRTPIALYLGGDKPAQTKILKVHRADHDEFVSHGQKPKSTINVTVLEYLDAHRPSDFPMTRPLDTIRVDIRNDNIVAKQLIKKVAER